MLLGNVLFEANLHLSSSFSGENRRLTSPKRPDSDFLKKVLTLFVVCLDQFYILYWLKSLYVSQNSSQEIISAMEKVELILDASGCCSSKALFSVLNEKD